MLPKELTNLRRNMRLDARVVEELLTFLDATTMEVCGEMRQAERYPYRSRRAIICLQPRDGTTASAFLISTRNLSAGGLAFLHGCYLEPESECATIMYGLDGHWHGIVGVIGRCRQISVMVQEVSVVFDKPIDPALFIEAASSTS